MALLRPCWSLVCFFFWRKRFLEQATQHAIDRELETNKQLAQDVEQYPDLAPKEWTPC